MRTSGAREAEPEDGHRDREGTPLVEVEALRVAFPDVEAQPALIRRQANAAAALGESKPAGSEPEARPARGRARIDSPPREPPAGAPAGEAARTRPLSSRSATAPRPNALRKCARSSARSARPCTGPPGGGR